jgi:transcriptional regulator with XRE-family HTH domain
VTLSRAIAKAVGLRLRTLRRARGMSLADVARAAHSYGPIIARLEGGRHTPSLDSVLAYCRAIDVHPIAVLSALDRFAPVFELEQRRRLSA